MRAWDCVIANGLEAIAFCTYHSLCFSRMHANVAFHSVKTVTFSPCRNAWGAPSQVRFPISTSLTAEEIWITTSQTVQLELMILSCTPWEQDRALWARKTRLCHPDRQGYGVAKDGQLDSLGDSPVQSCEVQRNLSHLAKPCSRDDCSGAEELEFRQACQVLPRVESVLREKDYNVRCISCFSRSMSRSQLATYK